MKREHLSLHKEAQVKNTIRLLLAIVPILFAVSYAHAIYYGHPADPIKSRATILFDARDYGADRGCSGVVQARNLILVAGHCLDPNSGRNMPQQFQAKITNASRVSRGSRVVEIIKWNRPSAYISKDEKTMAESQIDIGYVVVKDDLYKILNIEPGQVPEMVADPAELASIMASKPVGMTYGYGFSRRAQRAFDVDSAYEMKNEISQNVYQHEGQRNLIGASAEKNNGVCDGDSGGGLIVEVGGRQKLLGILSGIGVIVGARKTDDCSSENMRASYVNLAYHGCWIQRDSGVDLGLRCR